VLITETANEVKRMEALVWLGGDRLSVRDVEQPEPSASEALFRVSLAGICGSDLHAYRGAGGKRRPPLILGHEAVGKIDGDGRLFAVFPLLGCQVCPACQAGRENLCPRRQLLGLDRPGTFAELVAVPASALVPVPAGVPAEVAALTEPLATALAVFSGFELGPGQRVAVIGCDSIGLLAVYAAARAGCTVTAADPVASRRQAALEVGASGVADSAEDWAVGEADFVVDAVGIEQTWTAALRAVRPGGTVGVVGLGQNSGIVAVGDIVRSGLTLRGTYAYTREDFAAALAMLAGEPPPTASWLQCLPLNEGPAAFEGLAALRTPSPVKIMLRPAG
jgi:threonine dehydrogenase-like Zn-dependent dehydrogenase